MEFGLYKDSKLEQRKSSQNPGVFPTQSKIRNPLQIEILNSTEEAEDKAWIFFDKDESSPRGLLCQVGECTFQLTQDSIGSWSLEAAKDHLYTHGYKK